MKIKWLTLLMTSAILSGCTSMMYGGGVAPVRSENTYYGQAQRAQPQQPPMQNWQQPPQRPPVIAQPVENQVTTVQNVPPSVQQQQEQARLAAERAAAEKARQAANTGSASPSPYGNPATAQTPPAGNPHAADGWSVKPQNTPPTATDEPKYENSSNATNTAATNPPNNTQPPAVQPPAQPSTPPPVRPPERTDNVANTPPAQEVAPKQEPAKQEKQVAAANPPASSGGGSAVSTLLQKANGELGKGNLDGAVAYLEDAQRIDSKNANILYDIANIRYHQKRYREAEAAAAKAANAGGNSGVMRKSWSLIANARKALGDNQGAIAAAEKAASF